MPKQSPNHPWIKGISLAVERAKRRRANPRRRVHKVPTSWICPNCGAYDCQLSECVGGAY